MEKARRLTVKPRKGTNNKGDEREGTSTRTAMEEKKMPLLLPLLLLLATAATAIADDPPAPTPSPSPPACSGHGEEVDGKCVCSTPLPDGDKSGWIGNQCTQGEWRVHCMRTNA